MLVSSVIALLAIGFTSVSAADYAPYNLLKDDRDAGRLVFLPTTLAQKEVILSNVEKTLNSPALFTDHKKPSTDKCMIVVHVVESVEMEPA
ncbi:hypothetical protein BASA62_002326 [Batrachochytrium salamandrivorans]|nr:hypothetical protein BASA62_002326 [Batrachochytrium salamandrivorans]